MRRCQGRIQGLRLDILGNVVPSIGSEEDKLETEPLKTRQRRRPCAMAARINAHTNRVAVVGSHTMTVSVDLGGPPVADVIAADAAVQGRPQGRSADRAGAAADVRRREPPQPRLDADLSDSMSVSGGRVRGARC